MKSFVRRHLEPVDRLGEVLFALIMALGFTAAVRLGHEEADSRSLFVGILGCNVAWAIVDGVMYVFAALFERGRVARVLRDLAAAKSDEAALARVAEEVDGRLLPFTTEQERRHVHEWMIAVARRVSAPRVRLHVADLFGGVAVGVVILAATFPMLVPFLVVPDAVLAVRISHAIGLAALFLVGFAWGRKAGASPVGVGLGVTLVGAVLVVITVALGG